MNNISNSHKLIAGAAISALMVISMLAALPLASGSHTATVDVTPKEVKDNTRALFKISVSNASGSPDNIRRVTITNTAFSEAIAGSTQGENIENAADNLHTAEDYLLDAAGYLTDAASAKEDAGSSLEDMYSNLIAAKTQLNLTENYKTAASELGGAAYFLMWAGEELASEPENLDDVISNLNQAQIRLTKAGDDFSDTGGAWETYVDDNLEDAADRLDTAKVAIQEGSFSTAATNLQASAGFLDMAGSAMTMIPSSNPDSSLVISAGNEVISAANNENMAGVNLSYSYENLKLAGGMFGQGDNASQALQDAGAYLADIGCIESAGDNLQTAAMWLERAGDNLAGWTSTDNIYAAGIALSNLNTPLTNAGTTLMKSLGGQELQDAGASIANSGDNLSNIQAVSIENAATKLTEAGNYISAGADVLGPIGTTLKEDTPSGWIFNEPNMYWSADGGIGENTLAPGQSATLPVVLKVDGSGNEILKIHTRDTATPYATDTATFTIRVDAKDPGIASARVYQSAVGENNIVGNVFDNGMATVEIVATEELSSIGTVKLLANGENVMTLLLSSTDNIVYTGEFEVGEWDDNNLAISLDSMTDTFGRENNAEENIVYFDVDTRAPIFAQEGNAYAGGDNLENARSHWAKLIEMRDQDPENVWVTDNASWVINGYVKDNSSVGSWSGVAKLEAMINGTLVETGSIINNTFSADDVDMGNEGLKTITLKATDLTGNSVENSIDNILYDAEGASVDFVSPTDGTITNDNKIGVSATVSDSGIGIENAMLYYDNINGVMLDWTENYPISAILENDSAWTAIDPDLTGWPEGEHTIVAYATDNLYDNDTMEWSFTIDVTPPAAPQLTSVEDPATGKAIGQVINKSTMRLVGTGEKGSTVKIFQGREGTVVATTTVDSRGQWSVEITVNQDGTFTWYGQATDAAGNQSIKNRLRTQTVDTEAPTVQITKPQDGITTGKLTTTLEATVNDEITEATNLMVSLRSPEYTVPEGGVTVLSNGTLAVDVPLREGQNLITVLAKDEAGNVNSDAITVTRTVEEARNWEMYATIGAIIAIILAAIAIVRRSS